MGANSGALPQFKTGFAFPVANKLPANANVNYITNSAGVATPLAPMLTQNYVNTAILANGAVQTLITGVANTVHIVRKIWIITSIAGRFGLSIAGTRVAEFRTVATGTNFIDFGECGLELPLAVGDIFGILNSTGANADLETSVFGNLIPKQT